MSVPRNSNFLKNLIPFGVMMIGAFVGLAQFRKLNYSFSRNDQLTIFKENLKEAGMDEDDYQYRTTEGLKEQYDKVMKNIDLNNWENKRGPRPWENQQEMQQKLKKEAELRAAKEK